MATSKLPSPEVAKQKALPVVWDLFNTFVAAFTLARERTDASTKTRINSGPIGTGDFNNNVYLVYILQVLAARFVGISELVLFGYGTDKEPKEETAENLLRELDRILGTKTVSDLLSMIPQLDIPANPPRPRVL